MEVTEKQLSTLKDFDLDMFKNGTKTVSADFPSSTGEFVAEDKFTIVVRNGGGFLCTLIKLQIQSYNLKMLPLFFVEDKPVYPGDVLYFKENEHSWVATAEDYKEGDEKYFTWNKPKVKKEGWVNLYKVTGYNVVDVGIVYSTENEAKNNADNNRPYIGTVRIEWEE